MNPNRQKNADILNSVTRVTPVPVYTSAEKAHTDHSDVQSSQYSIRLPFRVASYTAEETWGNGGMSETYKGKDEQENEVIIKIPKNDPVIEKRFLSECAILRKLDSPYIAKWLADGIQEFQGQSRPYLVMSFVHGQTLRQRIAPNHPMPWSDVSAMLENTAEALKHLHEQGFCHRDIKPENLIYDQDNGRWVLVDFGIAHENRPELLLLTLLQNDGTWNYMAPEQQTNKAADIRSDIYALGTCAWEALIGTLPQRGTALPSKYEVDDERTVKDVTSEVDNLIEMMTEHHPENRFQTPDDLLLALKTTSSLVKAKLTIQRKWKRWVKLILFVGIFAAILSGVWFVGDSFCENKLQGIASSDNFASTKLNQIETMYRPFFWGESWYLSNISKLRKKGEEEKNKMEEGFHKLKEDCNKGDLSFDDKIIKCQNFIDFWKGAAGSHETIQEANKILANYEVISKLEDIGRQLDSAGENYDEILKIFANLNKITLQSEEANQRKNELSAKITDKTLGHISELVQKNTSETFEEACRILQLFIKIDGHDKRVSKLQDAIFDNLWKEAKVSDQTKLLSLKDRLRHYEDCFGKSQMSVDLSKIIDTKLTSTEWAETHKEARVAAGYWNDFMRAKSLIVEFEKKYPEFSKGDIRQAKKEIAEIYIKRIKDSYKEYDTCKKNVYLFHEHFASDVDEEDNRTVHKIMFNAAEWRMCQGMDKKKTDEVIKDDWEYCTDKHKAFLREIQKLAKEYCTSSNRALFKEVYFRRERYPDSYIYKDHSSRRFYKVTINKITVNLSHEYYKKIKGNFGCDVTVKMYKCDLDGSNPKDIKFETASDTSQVFTICPKSKVVFCLDTQNETLGYEVIDADLFDSAPSIGPFRYANPKVICSSSNPNHTLDWSNKGDSTKMYVEYTVE